MAVEGQRAAGAHVLVVEDEPSVANFVSALLRREGHAVEIANTLGAALAAVDRQQWELMVADLSLPDGDGTEAIERFRRRNPGAGIVVVTGFPDEAKARALEAYEISSFLVKPFDAQQLRFSIIGAAEKGRLTAHNQEVSSEIDRNSDLGLVGVSAYVREQRERIREFGRGKLPVLITGPSGTGKEIVARAIHACSSRTRQPIFAINCAAIPHHLEESEFFGYVKGAFTGAASNKNGIIASADGSTLFLDEVGELSQPVQAKLLRVLDSGEYMRVGEVQSHVVDVRVVSATNRDLQTMVAGGTFRQDLYFRLRGATITTQPLSEHSEDIPYLVHHFLRSESDTSATVQITDEALHLLQRHAWPGNVRELRLTVSMLRTASVGLRRINADSVRRLLQIQETSSRPAPLAYAVERDQFERDYFARLMKHSSGNATRAAKQSGILRPNLVRKLRDLGIDVDSYRIQKASAAGTEV